MSVSGIGANNAASLMEFAKPGGKIDPGQKAKEEFLAYVEKTPAERMRDTILGQMGLSSEDVAAMDEETLKKLEEKIRQMIEEKIQKAVEKVSGDIAPGALASITV